MVFATKRQKASRKGWLKRKAAMQQLLGHIKEQPEPSGKRKMIDALWNVELMNILESNLTREKAESRPVDNCELSLKQEEPDCQQFVQEIKEEPELVLGNPFDEHQLIQKIKQEPEETLENSNPGHQLLQHRKKEPEAIMENAVDEYQLLQQIKDEPEMALENLVDGHQLLQQLKEESDEALEDAITEQLIQVKEDSVVTLENTEPHPAESDDYLNFEITMEAETEQDCDSFDEEAIFECTACRRVFPEANILAIHHRLTTCGDTKQQKKIHLRKIVPACCSSKEPDVQATSGADKPKLAIASVCPDDRDEPSLHPSKPEESLAEPHLKATFNHPDDRDDAEWCQEPEMDEPGVKSFLECIKCNQQFARMLTFRLHKPNCLGDAQQSDTEQPPSALICQRCEVRFPSKKRADQHARFCEKEQLVLNCPQCPKVFYNRATYEGHQNRHQGARPFPCRKADCTKTFFSSQTRVQHEQKIHAGVSRKRQCELCGLTLNSSRYNCHMARHHEDRRFECELCDKKFFSKFSLQKHQSVHSDERNFECLVCGKRFKSHEANRVHQRIHTQEKPYCCDVCGMRFAYNCLLKAHVEKLHSIEQESLDQ